MAVTLVTPARAYLDGYVSALRKQWSLDHLRPDGWKRELAAVEKDADAYLASQVDREAKGPPIVLPDGSTARRLPGYRLWIWDGEFCGVISLRWDLGTAELPPHVLGHIGYGVVPWKRGRGLAKAALGSMLEKARGEGLPYVELTTDPDNTASRRVIESNGGVLVGRFVRGPEYGGTEGLRYRIELGTARTRTVGG